MNSFLRECWIADFKEHGKGTNADEHKIIAAFASKINCKKFLEIGTLVGDFARVMSQVYEVTTVDIKKNTEFDKWVKEGHAHSLEYYTEGSDKFFKQNINKFDLIFIDGDHSYKQSKKDLENSLKYLSDGGMIIMHDVKKTKRGTKECLRTYDEFNDSHYLKFRIKTKNWLGVIWHLG